MADDRIVLRIHDLESTDRMDAIRELMKDMVESHGFDAEYAQLVETEIVEREKLTPTAIGHGVAIPHARLERQQQVAAVLGRSEVGLSWDAPDGHPVHLVFLFVSPKQDIQIHTQTLSKIARIASERDFDEVTIRNLKSNDLWELLDDEEG